MIPVNSSNLNAVDYDADAKILTVRFNNGSVYDYYNVPKHHFDGLLSADSHGKYLDRYIKKGGYRYKERK